MLIEIIIAMTLSMLIISVVIEMYLNLQHSYHLQKSLNQIQHSAKVAIEQLNLNIKHAGYIGCMRLTNDFPITSYPPYSLSLRNRLTGSQSEITVVHAEGKFAQYIASPDNMTLLVRSRMGINRGNILIISDCKHAEIIEVSDVSISHDVKKISLHSPLHYLYDKHAEVSKLKINRFFIGKTQRINVDGTPIYALYVIDINGDQSELVPGVSRMKIQYDVVGVPAYINELTDGTNVIGVAIEFELNAPPLKKVWHSYISLKGN